MVRRSASSVLPRQTNEYLSGATDILNNEMQNLKKSFCLEPISMSSLNPSLIYILIFPLFIDLQCLCASFIISLIKGISTLNHKGFIITYFVLLAYIFLCALAYRSFLKSSTLSSYLSYVTVMMYTMIFIPIFLFFYLLLGQLGFVFSFATLLITQYSVSLNFLPEETSMTSKRRFLFAVLSFVLQSIFVSGVFEVIREFSATIAV
ncbi:hypothetical protein EDEG_03351 [Edhazardia aedis USNM 41457]|uniref:Protein YIP n=1 Tax=Edhazardia aedis (strain USNM 41457) TaxID=1003232 RepID=J9DLG0_EDHAE|nr:hypothetical protein EDEG_03351 [Edhazardia aedis USNM 41457]|eukprot:EJW02197.1 hypothetical protein EDEG_03351 [Edhazardia aedis USNM 41457]